MYLRFTASLVLHLFSPFLEQFQQVSLFYFHTWIQPTSTIFTFPHTLFMPCPLQLVPTSRQDCFTFLSFMFLKCILIVQGNFILVFQTCVYCVLIKLPPPITYSFSITLVPYYSIAYSAVRYTTFIHRCDISILSFSNVLLPSPPPCSPCSQNHWHNLIGLASTLGKSYVAFIMLKNVLSTPSFFRGFIIKGC
jgi:hypothetical protein